MLYMAEAKARVDPKVGVTIVIGSTTPRSAHKVPQNGNYNRSYGKAQPLGKGKGKGGPTKGCCWNHGGGRYQQVCPQRKSKTKGGRFSILDEWGSQQGCREEWST